MLLYNRTTLIYLHGFDYHVMTSNKKFYPLMTYEPIHDYKQFEDIDVKIYATLVFISFEYKHKICMLKQTKTKSTKN